MRQGNGQIMNNETFDEKYEIVQKKIGVASLSDEELLIIACREISRTYTFDEKNYQ
jgi:hypothetical protein